MGQGDDAALTNPTVDIPVILIAVSTLIVLGTLIGLIPAQVAVSIKPIEALRDE
jgi:putative ABC transport system permease protein